MKTRGLKEARVKLGDLEELVSKQLRKKKKLNIFESGCGYGRAMMELSKKFGNRVNIIGMNLKPEHGDKKIMTSLALKKGIIKKTDLRNFEFPKIIYGDAGEKLPFKNNSIDLVYSQTSAYLYKDKIHFFEEVARVLTKDGIARITKPIKTDEVSEEFQLLLRIYDKGKPIPFKDYIKRFKDIKIIELPSGKSVIEITSGKLNLKLKLISTVNLNHLNKRWYGMISIYTTQR